MKIVYINGFKGEASNKPIEFAKLLETEIEHIKFIVNPDGTTNVDEVTELAKDADLIIASSTGGYIAIEIAYNFNIPLITTNAITNYNMLLETFKKLDHKIDLPDYRNVIIAHLSLVNADDELIEHDLNILGEVVVFNKGGHRFTNLEETIPYIKDFMNRNII